MKLIIHHGHLVLIHEQIFIFPHFYLDGLCQLIHLHFEKNNTMKTFHYTEKLIFNIEQ